MYFYELIEKCDLESIVSEFLIFCEASPNIDLTEKSIRSTIMSLDGIEANISDTEIIIIKKEQTNDETYDNVYMLDASDKMTYGIEINPWSKTLGYRVDEESLSLYGNERFVALVLWEMTWLGFDDETIQEKVKSWDEDLEN